MKLVKAVNIQRIFLVGIFLYLHYCAILLWVSVRFDDIFLLSLFFFHCILPPALLSIYFDVEVAASIPIRKKASIFLKGLAFTSLLTYLYFLFILMKRVHEGSLFALHWQSVTINVYALLILILANYMDILKKKKEYLREARPYFFSLYRNTLSLTILSLLVQIILAFISDRIVFYFGITSLLLVGLDQITVIVRMLIYQEDYFIK